MEINYEEKEASRLVIMATDYSFPFFTTNSVMKIDICARVACLVSLHGAMSRSAPSIGRDFRQLKRDCEIMLNTCFPPQTFFDSLKTIPLEHKFFTLLLSRAKTASRGNQTTAKAPDCRSVNILSHNPISTGAPVCQTFCA
jgi:hypothetical protein